MDALQCLLTRSATGALQEPAPSALELELILRAAGRAPDHGALKPWRFLIVESEQRQQLGRLFAQSALAADPQLSLAQQQRYESMPLRAPLLIIVYASIQPHPKVSENDQCYAVAAACQNLMLAVHALGYAGIWRSGELAESSALKQGLGLTQTAHIIGFLYLGSAKSETRAVDNSLDSERIKFWRPNGD